MAQQAVGKNRFRRRNSPEAIAALAVLIGAPALLGGVGGYLARGQQVGRQQEAIEGLMGELRAANEVKEDTQAALNDVNNKRIEAALELQKASKAAENAGKENNRLKGLARQLERLVREEAKRNAGFRDIVEKKAPHLLKSPVTIKGIRKLPPKKPFYGEPKAFAMRR